MKKISLFVLILFFPMFVFAQNKIYSIDMNIYLNEDGSANITENWVVNGSDGTEWYKAINGLDENTLTDFTVKMDGNALTFKSWDVNESLSAKKGYYGINYTSSGIELCFGKYDYHKHTFTLNYKIKDYIVNVDDAQILYWNLIDRLSDVDFENFSVNVSAYYTFPDTLDVWGYGYKGYAYVKDGKIMMSNEENTDMNDLYVVLLAKFPLGTFSTTKNFTLADNFEDVLSLANEGTFEYNYDDNTVSTFQVIIQFISEFIPAIIFFTIAIISSKKALSKGYGYKNNRKIDKKDVNLYREIPCNKDIYYADTLIYLNNFNYNETNILGAIILKWIKEDKIIFKNETKGIFNKETSSIDMTKEVTFENEIEEKLFEFMKKASGDGILETKELEKYCKRHYNEFFDLFKNGIKNQITNLKNSQEITVRKDKNECKKQNVMSDHIYEESKKLLGLKMYLEQFASMDEKQAIEVKIWDEYLMFAYLFGIADKVAKQLKKLYPEVVIQLDYDLDTVIFINHISHYGANAASSARSAAQSYSGGGGGFSSGGGGGGSFGGGGGGSR